MVNDAVIAHLNIVYLRNLEEAGYEKVQTLNVTNMNYIHQGCSRSENQVVFPSNVVSFGSRLVDQGSKTET